MPLHPRAVVALVTVTALLLGGCVTTTPTTTAPTTTPMRQHTYDDARTKAEALWESYRLRAREQTLATNLLYAWLSAIAATIMGLGITGTTGAPITGLALGGAFSYGLGTWFTKPEHLAIYKAGADAMYCVRDKSRPLGSAEVFAKDLEAALEKKALQTALNELALAVAELKEAAGADEGKRAAALDNAREAEETGRAMLRTARALLRSLKEAGDQYWITVEAVETEVDFAIRRNTDPRDIMAHIQQNVVGAYKGLTAFGTGLAAKASDAGGKAQRALLSAPEPTEFERKLTALHLAVARVVAETQNLSALVDATSIPGVSEAMAGCLAAAQGGLAIPRIAVSPSEITLQPGKSESVLVIGTTNPILRNVPSSAPFTTATSASDGNTTVTVKASDGAAAGEYVLDVKVPIASHDTTDRTVKVTIVKPPAAAASPGAGATSKADINTVLTAKGWKCGDNAWTARNATGGGFEAFIVCDDATASALISAHAEQIKKLKEKNPKSSVASKEGKLHITVPEAKDVDALVEAINAALS